MVENIFEIITNKNMKADFTIFSLHPVFLSLYNIRMPKSHIIIGKNFIMDGHHTLYNFFNNTRQGKRVSLNIIDLNCYDICDLYTENNLYKFTEHTETYYLKNINTNKIYAFIFPVVKENNGYIEFSKRNYNNKVIQNALQHLFYFIDKTDDIDYTDGMVSEYTEWLLEGTIKQNIINLHYETTLVSFGDRHIQEMYDEVVDITKDDVEDIDDIESLRLYLTDNIPTFY